MFYPIGYCAKIPTYKTISYETQNPTNKNIHQRTL